MIAFLPLAMLQAPSGTNFLTKPDIHGTQVVFTAEGDLWLGDTETLVASRLTRDEGVETWARFSPDGKTIAFTAQYDDGTNVYVMPTDGGEPRQITWSPRPAQVMGWSPDGKEVLYRRAMREDARNVVRLFSVPAQGGLSRPIAVPRGEFGSYLPDGRLLYVPVSREWMNWFRYRGGAADDVWVTDLKGGFRRLTTDPGVDTTPVWGGDAAYFVSDRTGSLNLWRLDVASGRQSPVTKNTDNEIRYPSSDGKRVVFEAGPVLAVYDSASKSTRPLSFRLPGDRRRARPLRLPLADAAESFALGPTGRRVAVIARGQVHSLPAETGDRRPVDTQAGARASYATWSPDGKRIAYVSDRTRENEIWTSSAEGGDVKQLTRGLQANVLALKWSPDGKTISFQDRTGRTGIVDAANGAVNVLNQSSVTGSYDSFRPALRYSPNGRMLAFVKPELNFLFSVMVADLDRGAVTQVSPAGMNAVAPAFSPDGKYLAYLADRGLDVAVDNFTRRYTLPRPVQVTVVALDPTTRSPFADTIDEEGEPAKPAEAVSTLEGITARAVDSPVPAGTYDDLLWGDGRLLLTRPDRPGAISGLPSGSILQYDLEKKSLSTFLSNARLVELSKDGKKLLVVQDDEAAIVDTAGGDPKAVPLTGFVSVDTAAEWRQIYWESWRMVRDLFFDPGLGGVDWEAVGRKYEARLPFVGDRADLTRVLKDLVSELATGHAYVRDPSPVKTGLPMGYLGADFAPAAQGVQIVRLLRGDDFSPRVQSPLLAPGVGVKEGEYLLRINGEAISPERDVQSYLVGLGGQTVSLTINAQPSLEGARTIRVKLLSDESELRYQTWVSGRRHYVEQKGGQNFGYLHLPDMVEAGVQGFVRGQMPNREKDAVVVDLRANGGGFVSSLLLESLAGRRYAYWHSRSGAPWNREDWTFRGHLAALCNEYNFSDGELFVEAWKNLKLGPVVGKRTGGGEIGSGGGYSLVDGGSIYVPNYAAYVDGRWLIEGTGATPTHEVEQDPAAELKGSDPQLDRAIELLKERLAKDPIREPVRPPFVRKAGG